MSRLITANQNLYTRFYADSSPAESTIKKADEIKNPPQLIQALKSTVEAASDSAELTDFFSRATGGDRGFIKVSNIEYALGEYKVLVAVSELADNLEENLKTANSLGLQSAPILIEKISSKNPNLKVVVSYEPGLAGDVTQYDTFARADLAGKLDPQAKRIFLKEVEALHDAGYINPAILDDRISLKINPQSGLIFASNWESLEGSNPEAKEEYLESVKQALQIQ